MAKQFQLIYALKNDSIVSISEVESGKKCNCCCPACGEQLVAKKGKKMMHHFAHFSGTTCAYGYESSLHLAAKEILSNAKKMVLPSVNVEFPGSYKRAEVICGAKEIDIEKVELEKRFDSIVPDIVVYAGGKTLFVEIYVTHSVDDIKLAKLRNANISTIEIDLSKQEKTISTEELTNILLSDSDEKQWKYNRLSERYLSRFKAVSEKKRIANRGYTLHVDNCPIKKRTWRGKPYANYLDDCLSCKYCIENGETVLCSGKARVATVADFSLSEEERKKRSDLEMRNMKEAALSQGKCPNCGGSLVERHSDFGFFLGCSNYPHCRFKASPDPETGEIILKV